MYQHRFVPALHESLCWVLQVHLETVSLNLWVLPSCISIPLCRSGSINDPLVCCSNAHRCISFCAVVSQIHLSIYIIYPVVARQILSDPQGGMNTCCRRKAGYNSVHDNRFSSKHHRTQPETAHVSKWFTELDSIVPLIPVSRAAALLSLL